MGWRMKKKRNVERGGDDSLGWRMTKRRNVKRGGDDYLGWRKKKRIEKRGDERETAWDGG
jgi:hypothetical protein